MRVLYAQASDEDIRWGCDHRCKRACQRTHQDVDHESRMREIAMEKLRICFEVMLPEFVNHNLQTAIGNVPEQHGIPCNEAGLPARLGEERFLEGFAPVSVDAKLQALVDNLRRDTNDAS